MRVSDYQEDWGDTAPVNSKPKSKNKRNQHSRDSKRNPKDD